jgi:hypothetical protein
LRRVQSPFPSDSHRDKALLVCVQGPKEMNECARRRRAPWGWPGQPVARCSALQGFLPRSARKQHRRVLFYELLDLETNANPFYRSSFLGAFGAAKNSGIGRWRANPFRRTAAPARQGRDRTRKGLRDHSRLPSCPCTTSNACAASVATPCGRTPPYRHTTFLQELWAACKDLALQSLYHPFPLGIAQGTLPK